MTLQKPPPDAPAATPEEHALVFASLAEPALIEHLRARAMVQDTMALSTAFDRGLFNARDLLDAVPELVPEGPKHRINKQKQKDVYAQTDEIVEGWASRLSAVTAFLRNGTMEVLTTDPVLGPLDDDMSILVLGATDEFQALFGRIALDVVDQMHRVLGNGKRDPSIREGHTDPLDETLALLTAGAVVLNLSHVAAQIVDMSPESPATCFDSSWMGPAFQELLVEDRDSQVTPVGVALLFSRTNCLQAIQTASRRGGTMPPDLLLGREKFKHEPDTAYRDVRFSKNLENSLFRMACTPTAFRWGLDDALHSKAREAIPDVQSAALNAISKDDFLADYTPAFLAAGCYDAHVTRSVVQASRNGLARIVQDAGNPPRMGNGWPENGRQVRAVNWRGMAETHREQNSALYRALEAIHRDVAGTPESTLALLRRAQKEGGLDHVIRPFLVKADLSRPSPLVSWAEPMHMAILANQPEIVVTLLNAGVSPTEPQFPGVPSALEMADQLQRPEMVHAIRTWSLRNAARKMLDSMDEPPTKAAP